MVCLSCFRCRSISRKEIFYVTFQWWRWKALKLLGLYMLLCTHFFVLVQIKWKKFNKWVLKRSESVSCGLKSQRWLKLSSLSLDSVTTVGFNSCQALLPGSKGRNALGFTWNKAGPCCSLGSCFQPGSQITPCKHCACFCVLFLW